MPLVFVILLLVFSPMLQAQPRVQVVGLFPNAAVLNIDGQRKLVKVGQIGPRGVEVLSATSNSARLKVAGVENEYFLEREYSGTGYAEPNKLRVNLQRGQGGHYWTNALVNGRQIHFMVDTGATGIALNESHAKRIGINFRRDGTPITVSTASGEEMAWRVRLNSVKVSGIEVLGVDATVLEGEFPRDALLGMSFMSRVSWREEQGLLVLEARN